MVFMFILEAGQQLPARPARTATAAGGSVGGREEAPGGNPPLSPYEGFLEWGLPQIISN